MGSTFKPSYAGIGEMLRADYMQEDMRRRAERVKARAESTAPVDERGPHPGRYKNAFRLESGIKPGRGGGRAVARVINDAPEAFAVEYGTRNNTAHHTMVNALDAAGDA